MSKLFFLGALLFLVSCSDKSPEKVELRKRVLEINKKLNELEKVRETFEDSIVREP